MPSDIYRFEEDSSRTGLSDTTPKSRTKERVVFVVLILALIGALIGVSIYFTNKNNDLEDDNAKKTSKLAQLSQIGEVTESPTTDSLPDVDVLNKRIDCIPEAASKFVEATEELCHKRGCYFQKSGVDGVPDCYFSEKVGYSVKSYTETSLGLRLKLELNGNGGPFGNDWKHVDLNVEMRGNDIIRFTVCIYMIFIRLFGKK